MRNPSTVRNHASVLSCSCLVCGKFYTALSPRLSRTGKSRKIQKTTLIKKLSANDAALESDVNDAKSTIRERQRRKWKTWNDSTNEDRVYVIAICTITSINVVGAPLLLTSSQYRAISADCSWLASDLLIGESKKGQLSLTNPRDACETFAWFT